MLLSKSKSLTLDCVFVRFKVCQVRKWFKINIAKWFGLLFGDRFRLETQRMLQVDMFDYFMKCSGHIDSAHTVVVLPRSWPKVNEILRNCFMLVLSAL